MKKDRRLLYAVLLLLAAGCILLFVRDDGEAPVGYTYKIVNSFNHDPHAFTQGLVFADGFLYEGTGLYGASSLRKVELKTGKVLQSHSLPAELYERDATSSSRLCK